MRVHYQDDTVTLWHGDCLDVLRELPDVSVDAVVTDPPYGLGFMGKEWDSIKQAESRPPSADETDARFNNAYPRTGKGPAAVAFDGRAFQDWCRLWAAECLRVLKPGGHLLAFGGSRTWHRLACAVEDAGFEIRDSIAWLYGSGFPKSLDVSKAIDRAAGAERVDLGPGQWAHVKAGGTWHGDVYGAEPEHGNGPRLTAPATPDAERWQGWGTALKPAFEPVVVARKPLAGTVAGNVLAHGTGALNIDACRIGMSGEDFDRLSTWAGKYGGTEYAEAGNAYSPGLGAVQPPNPAGRWPANVVLDESQAAELDQQSGSLTSGTLAAHHARNPKDAGILGAYRSAPGERGYGDEGGASRFFYVAKADASERPRVDGVAHPTVKPLELMRWLVRLVTPPGGVVLEPFAGSGTTVEACILEGFRCVAVEREGEYLPTIELRVARQRDPVRAIELKGEDAGLFSLFDEDTA